MYNLQHLSTAFNKLFLRKREQRQNQCWNQNHGPELLPCKIWHAARQINVMQLLKRGSSKMISDITIKLKEKATYSMRWELHNSKTPILLLLTNSGVSTVEGHGKINSYNIWKNLRSKNLFRCKLAELT